MSNRSNAQRPSIGEQNASPDTESYRSDVSPAHSTADLDTWSPPEPMKGRGEPLEFSDLLHPSTLVGKTLGTDYILLAHIPRTTAALAKILSEGMKSQSRLDAEAGISEAPSSAHFNQRHFMYFRPLILDKERNIVYPESIVVAAQPNSVNVFDQDVRGLGTNTQQVPTEESRQQLYVETSIKASEYSDRYERLPAAHYLSSYGYPTPYTLAHLHKAYYPESAANTDIIPPDMFVDHSTIPQDNITLARYSAWLE